MRAHIRMVIRTTDGIPVNGVRVFVYKPGTTTIVADTLFRDATGSITKTNPFTTVADGVAEAYFDIPGTDVPGLVTLSWDGGGPPSVSGSALVVVPLLELGTSIWPLLGVTADTAAAPQVYWYVDKFRGHDFGEAGYWGDGYAGVTPDKPFRTIGGAVLKVPVGAKAILVLGGNSRTDIATMLASPGSYHVYELTAQLLMTATIAGVIGQGVDAHGGKANTLIVDGSGFPADTHLVGIGGAGGPIRGFGVVNRVGPGILLTGCGPGTDVRSVAAYKCNGHGFEVRGNGNDLLVLDRCESYFNSGHGYELAETPPSADLSNMTTLRDCDGTGNLLADVHVAMLGLSTSAWTSGNGLRFLNLRAHQHGLLGKIFLEGGHDMTFDRGYWELSAPIMKDTPMFTVRGARPTNGGDWAASTQYSVGDYVRGVGGVTAPVVSGAARWGYWKCVTAGTTGTSEPKWGIGIGSIPLNSATLSCDQAVFAAPMAPNSTIIVYGAGANGGPLTATIASVAGDGKSVTLNQPAATAATNVPFVVTTIADGSVVWAWSIPPGPRRWTDLPAGVHVASGHVVIPSDYPSNAVGNGHGKAWQCTIAARLALPSPVGRTPPQRSPTAP